MRIVSHTCSNTEIVCALGLSEYLVAVDQDSDYPPQIVEALPKLGRDLSFDADAAAALEPDLVLTSLTLPGHEKIVADLQSRSLPTLVCDPHSLADVYNDITRIADALGVAQRGRALIDEMRASMPAVQPAHRPATLIEWWPKPVIAPARRSWAHDLLELAGGRNAADDDEKSVQFDAARATNVQVELIVMSWCGVSEDKYRADVVLRREGWYKVPAIKNGNVFPITEAHLGRPGPRLVEGYRRLREAISSCGGTV